MESDKEYFLRLKEGAEAILEAIKKNISNINELNDQTLLYWMSGFTGLSCQMPIWEGLRGMQLPVETGFMVVKTSAGRRFFMGDVLNFYLAQSPCSIWKQVQSVYYSWIPYLTPPSIVEYEIECIENIYKPDFKIWGYIDPFEMTKKYKGLWDYQLEDITKKYCRTAAEWPITFGQALQMAMMAAGKVLDHNKCFDMMAENLLFMAQVDYSVEF